MASTINSPGRVVVSVEDRTAGPSPICFLSEEELTKRHEPATVSTFSSLSGDSIRQLVTDHLACAIEKLNSTPAIHLNLSRFTLLPSGTQSSTTPQKTIKVAEGSVDEDQRTEAESKHKADQLGEDSDTVSFDNADFSAETEIKDTTSLVRFPFHVSAESSLNQLSENTGTPASSSVDSVENEQGDLSRCFPFPVSLVLASNNTDEEVPDCFITKSDERQIIPATEFSVNPNDSMLSGSDISVHADGLRTPARRVSNEPGDVLSCAPFPVSMVSFSNNAEQELPDYSIYTTSEPQLIPKTEFSVNSDKAALAKYGISVQTNGLGQLELSREAFTGSASENLSTPKRTPRTVNANRSSGRVKERHIKTISCPCCSGSFTKRTLLLQHVKCTHMFNSSVDCSDCGKKMSSATIFLSHQKTHSELEVYSCEQCPKRFKCLESLKRHAILHLPKENLTCDICGLAMSSKSGVKKHMAKQHSEEEPSLASEILYADDSSQLELLCKRCKMTFKDQKIFETHIIVCKGKHNKVLEGFKKSSEDINFPCSVCGLNLSCKAAFKSHMRIHTHRNIHQCDSCEKAFQTHSALKIHVATIHTGERPYMCKVCGKSFVQRYRLKCHLKTHTNTVVKSCICEICGSAFQSRSGLVDHKRIHTGEKPFECKTCGKRFNHRGNFAFHMKNHRGERPYQCEHCGLRFLKNTDLNRHRRKHTGETPYKCTLCEKAFPTRTQWKDHFHHHAGGKKPFVCDFCGSAFSSVGTRRRHLRNFHKNETEAAKRDAQEMSNKAGQL